MKVKSKNETKTFFKIWKSKNLNKENHNFKVGPLASKPYGVGGPLASKPTDAPPIICTCI